MKFLFAGTIFTSAFLLFLVQPLIAKQILPWFGGSAAVWSICLVFFQVLLLAGYAYSDAVTRRLSAHWQARVHVALLLASLAFLPIVTDARWKPVGAEDPTLWILGLLLFTIGLPYFLLSTTGPLLQHWLTRTPWGGQVYRYFSLSNLASLGALLCYPVLIEPYSTLLHQAQGWSWGYAVFVLLCAVTALYAVRHAGPTAATAASVSSAPPPRLGEQLLWLALPALGSWLLLAVSNHLTQNVAAIPFLWVLPLSVYLFTFVLCFESERWYRRAFFLPASAIALLLCAFGLQHNIGFDLHSALPIYVAGLFALCMFLHGETARLRPAPRYLTRFYLMLSLGGAIGGISVGLGAPYLLPAYYELGLGLVLVALAGAVVLRSRSWGLAGGLVLALVCGVFLLLQVRADVTESRVLMRNFYGTLVTLDTRRDDPRDDVRQMYHGSVKHGEQFLAPERRREPTSYYGASSGFGVALAEAPQGPRRVGVIGLGAGVMTAYGRPGDVYRVYEINPQVFDLADREFSFLADSPARIERVLGDARLALEREAPQRFDLLAVDAFSGGSVPIHLVTAEAMAAYLRHIQPEGVIAFNVTNRRLALAPVVDQVAKSLGLHAVLVHDEAEQSSHLRATDWMLVARRPEVLTRDSIRRASQPVTPIAGLKPWTDDFNNLFQVLK
ncbi:spermidine synthase [Variovorax sp. LARHSF232]